MHSKNQSDLPMGVGKNPDLKKLPKILTVLQPTKKNRCSQFSYIPMIVSENGYKYKMLCYQSFGNQSNHVFHCSKRFNSKCPYAFLAKFLPDKATGDNFLDANNWKVISAFNAHTCIPVGTDQSTQNLTKPDVIGNEDLGTWT